MTGPSPESNHAAFAVDEAGIAPLPRLAIQVFCLTSALADLVENAAQDRRMARVQMRVQTGGISAAIEAFRDAPTPNLILIEFRDDEVETLPFALDELSNHCDPTTRVVVIGPINDVQLYRETIRRGVSDYLVLPLTPLEMIAALSELYHSKKSQKIGRCVSFVSAKGGCGSSTLSHNVAWAAATQLFIPTILVDTDLPFGTAALNINQDPINGLAEILFAQEKPDANMIERLLCKVTDYLSLLPSLSTVERSYDLPPSGLDDVMDTMRTMVPLTLIDLPHHWAGWVQRVVAASDDLIIVAEPDLASLRNAKQIVEQATRMRTHDRPATLVLNKVNLPKRPEIPFEEFVKPFPACTKIMIAFDAQLFGTAANNGQMLLEAGASSALEKNLSELALIAAGRVAPTIEKSKNPLSDILSRLSAFRR